MNKIQTIEEIEQWWATLNPTYLKVLIAVAAGVALCAELSMIRVHTSYFLLLAYFKNVSLLSCFLGIGIGFLNFRKKSFAIAFFVPALALQMVILHVTRAVLPDASFLTVPASMLSPSDSGFGDYVATNGFVLLIFFVNASCFIPIGMIIGKLMNRLPPVMAYSANLVGSLLGIIVFFVLISLSTSPAVWFIALCFGTFALLWHSRVSLLLTSISTLLLVGTLSLKLTPNSQEFFSPYQIINLTNYRLPHPVLLSNNLYFQRILDFKALSPELQSAITHYSFPYKMKQNADSVLIVGSGTGNDVAAALSNTSAKIDAVEIDPLIADFGKTLHPQNPYGDPRTTLFLNDARSFFRNEKRTYDLIVYGLLDTHATASHAAPIRLDSFVFTTEGFTEAGSHLTKEGVLCVSFAADAFSADGAALKVKLFGMLKAAFGGVTPLVHPTYYDSAFTLCGGPGVTKELITEYDAKNITEELLSRLPSVQLSTDDWPFLYMTAHEAPMSYLLILGGCVLLSVVMIRSRVPSVARTFRITPAALGIGFMLIEIKAISQLALVWGNTWMVMGLVIAGILIMAFLANLFVLYKVRCPTWAIYTLLIFSLALGYLLEPRLLATPGGLGMKLVSLLVIVLPLFFSGLAFSREIESEKSELSAILASNLLGAMVGGILENACLYFGFFALTPIAACFYLVAAFASRHIEYGRQS